eukprot:TRINITY_DN45833_c0_g1_i1.p1 TRINITY_DN45833_c0_g1~~TRINITY_DN45833_c0_g1_i1.p1  ORF type:complete len:266 (-),score=25.28 TRINITY_DN45833_c0_g1_i1:343-1065(-)
MVPLEEDPERPVEIQFSTLDGTTAIVCTSGGVTMGALRQEIALALGLVDDGAARPPPFLMTLIPTEGDSAEHVAAGDLRGGGIDAAGKILSDASLAAEVADGANGVLVVVGVEPDDCRNKRFVYKYVCAPDFGRERDEEIVTLNLSAGGVFTYHRYFYFESGSWHQSRQKATGQWFFCEDGEGGTILLTGEAEESIKRNRMKDTITRKNFSSSYRRKELLGEVPASRGRWSSEWLPGTPV